MKTIELLAGAYIQTLDEHSAIRQHGDVFEATDEEAGRLIRAGYAKDAEPRYRLPEIDDDLSIGDSLGVEASEERPQGEARSRSTATVSEVELYRGNDG